MYVYVCKYIHTYIHTYVHTYIYIYVYVCVYIYIFIYNVHTNTCTHTHRDIYIYVYANTHMHTHVWCICVSVYMHVHIRDSHLEPPQDPCILSTFQNLPEQEHRKGLPAEIWTSKHKSQALHLDAISQVCRIASCELSRMPQLSKISASEGC